LLHNLGDTKLAPSSIDDKDREILALLHRDAWMTQVEIGEKINLSPSAVQRRIERLRSSGAILGAHAAIDPRKASLPTRIYMLIQLKNDRRDSLDKLVRAISTHTEVLSIELLAGNFDILLTVDCQDIEAFFEFAMDSINADENILHVSTHTRIKRLA
jgi:Lrp/AsnC family leucine-responsive transcriptional regulator